MVIDLLTPISQLFYEQSHFILCCKFKAVERSQIIIVIFYIKLGLKLCLLVIVSYNY